MCCCSKTQPEPKASASDYICNFVVPGALIATSTALHLVAPIEYKLLTSVALCALRCVVPPCCECRTLGKLRRATALGANISSVILIIRAYTGCADLLCLSEFTQSGKDCAEVLSNVKFTGTTISEAANVCTTDTIAVGKNLIPRITNAVMRCVNALATGRTAANVTDLLSVGQACLSKPAAIVKAGISASLAESILLMSNSFACIC
jgi:hypothetical protein